MALVLFQHSLAMFTLEQSCKSARPFTLSARVLDQPAIEAAVKAVHASIGPWDPQRCLLGLAGPVLDQPRMTSAPCDTNVLGTLLASRAFAPLLGADQTGGREGTYGLSMSHPSPAKSGSLRCGLPDSKVRPR